MLGLLDRCLALRKRCDGQLWCCALHGPGRRGAAVSGRAPLCMHPNPGEAKLELLFFTTDITTHLHSRQL